MIIERNVSYFYGILNIISNGHFNGHQFATEKGGKWRDQNYSIELCCFRHFPTFFNLIKTNKLK